MGPLMRMTRRESPYEPPSQEAEKLNNIQKETLYVSTLGVPTLKKKFIRFGWVMNISNNFS